MANFSFFFFDALGTVKESASSEQPSDKDAIAEAERQLAERCAFAAVEIWRGSSLVQTLKRGEEGWKSQPLGTRLDLHPLFEAEFDAV